ncbi:MAG TPA: NAD(P)-dependent oxidoreductase, partial [Methylomirabilota bacterium]|nr:NAD(P)-dependent oxidoreductase [Methylomirabilota bacterium]
MATLGFVGLGAMGSRLATRLMAAGHTVVGYNRTAEKARALVAAGLRLERTPRAVAEATDTVFSMITDDAALRAVAVGPEGVVAGLRSGAVWVEMSTVGPAVVRELGDAVAARGAAILDVPVSGSTITVEQGTASFQVGGDPKALDRVRPYLAAMGSGGVTHVGPLGLAKTMKVATNLGL